MMSSLTTREGESEHKLCWTGYQDNKMGFSL